MLIIQISLHVVVQSIIYKKKTVTSMLMMIGDVTSCFL